MIGRKEGGIGSEPVRRVTRWAAIAATAVGVLMLAYPLVHTVVAG